MDAQRPHGFFQWHILAPALQQPAAVAAGRCGAPGGPRALPRLAGRRQQGQQLCSRLRCSSRCRPGLFHRCPAKAENGVCMGLVLQTGCAGEVAEVAGLDELLGL